MLFHVTATVRFFYQLIRKTWEKLSMFESSRKVVYCFIITINYIVKSLYIVALLWAVFLAVVVLTDPQNQSQNEKVIART